MLTNVNKVVVMTMLHVKILLDRSFVVVLRTLKAMVLIVKVRISFLMLDKN
jgi:hypothetical protein